MSLRRVLFGTIVLLALAATPSALAQETHCPPGQAPRFVFGFADLKAFIGLRMGDPLTCEFPDPNGTGDIHQRTSTGLAFWRKSTNTPTFTNGWEHWALTPEGVITWVGPTIDPPSSPLGMAERYIRALYEGDDATARELYLFHSPDSRPDEAKVHLDSLEVQPLSNAEAGDHNPLSEWSYARVTTRVSLQDRRGTAKYTVGLMPMPQVGGALRVNMISGTILWERP